MFFTPERGRAVDPGDAWRRTGPSGSRRWACASVADLCCGIGGDAIALARAGIRVLAVDRDPLTVAVARANAEALGLADLIEVREADVTEVDTAGVRRRVRRPGPARRARPDLRPGGLLAAAVLGRRRRPARPRCAALKIAPGIPHEAIPAEAEAEWISDGGDVKEAVLWFGDRGPGARAGDPAARAARAALRRGRCPIPRSGPVGRYLYEPDGAVIRAHLVAEVAEELGRRADRPDHRLHHRRRAARRRRTRPRTRSPTRLPFGVKKLKALLREREVGILTVKKRGSAVEPEELRRKVKPQGPNSATVFLTRVAGAPDDADRLPGDSARGDTRPVILRAARGPSAGYAAGVAGAPGRAPKARTAQR